jgi:hypothetical protein
MRSENALEKLSTHFFPVYPPVFHDHMSADYRVYGRTFISEPIESRHFGLALEFVLFNDTGFAHVYDGEIRIMSLTENIVRRAYRPLELLADIEQLNQLGDDKRVIAQKTGLSLDYVKGILLLLEKGEERLPIAVEGGRVPFNVAITIAGASNEEAVQTALQDAYESGKLRGGQVDTGAPHPPTP